VNSASSGSDPGQTPGRKSAGAFLAGAISRLLPPSIPFRFFGAAVAFHVAAWIALFAGADAVPRFAGGLGWALAGLHLVTLGVLAMTAIGASLQLLPVATRQPVGATRWPALVWWLYTPGVAATALGMGIPSPTALAIGGALVVATLAIFVVLLARNLLGAKGMPAVVAHGWIAVVSLALVLATALSLAGAYAGLRGLARPAVLALHVAFAAYGFMGMLALGLSYILVPMFALSALPDDRSALASAAFAAGALVLALAAALGTATAALRVLAIALGAAAVAIHLRLMARALATGLRRELGLSFRLVRSAWGFLAASLAAALAVALDTPFEAATPLFGLLAFGGWLTTFLFGVLQRIVPFLASMHAGRGAAGTGRLPPTPSALTAHRPLAVHAACHLAALALLAAAVLADSALLARAGAAVGAAGAIAFAAFFAAALRRMRRPADSRPGPGRVS
jgi:hypothetical protein